MILATENFYLQLQQIFFWTVPTQMLQKLQIQQWVQILWNKHHRLTVKAGYINLIIHKLCKYYQMLGIKLNNVSPNLVGRVNFRNKFRIYK